MTSLAQADGTKICFPRCSANQENRGEVKDTKTLTMHPLQTDQKFSVVRGLLSGRNRVRTGWFGSLEDSSRWNRARLAAGFISDILPQTRRTRCLLLKSQLCSSVMAASAKTAMI
uniref:Uncharacterized protein n=1 Tax=Papio anubis TaxID=9555 RepID=A0A8I5NQZ7_PAPAN